MPDEQRIVFVGALEPYKNIRGLAEAWTRISGVATRGKADGDRAGLSAATGRGARRAIAEARCLRARSSARAGRGGARRARARSCSRRGRRASAASSSKRSRVGRTAVATDAGGIPDIVTDEHDGLLVPAGDIDALVAALLRVIDDRELAVRLGDAARATYASWHQTPKDFARAYRDLVDRALAGAR